MPIVEPLPAAALAGLSVVALVLARRVRTLLAETEELRERVDALSARLSVAEEEVSVAVARTGVAETVLLEKGLADEEDLEAARRRSDDAPGVDVPRDDLH